MDWQDRLMPSSATPPRLGATLLSMAAGVSAALTIAPGGGRWGALPIGYVFKPLATVLILVLAATACEPPSRRYQWSVVAGLACSLAGDVLLMLTADHFLAGLLAFLLAHGWYLVAFTSDSRLAAKRGPFVVGAALGVWVVAALWSRVPPALRGPVVAYTFFIVGMAAQATSRALVLRTRPAAAAALGAALFVVSDTLLALDRFGGGLPASGLLVLGSYFPAQWLIAMSARSGTRLERVATGRGAGL
jgi:uncharacterized membrane protein YhhN